mgnify:CR=1 FL=1
MLPLYPLFVKDPYFSLWIEKREKRLFVKTWWGEEKSVYGYLKVASPAAPDGDKTHAKGKIYSFFGEGVYGTPMNAEIVGFDAVSTTVRFSADGVKLTLRFVSALPLDRLDVLSCPVCEINYRIETEEKKDATIYFALGGNVCYNALGGQSAVRGYSYRAKDGYAYAVFGRDEQKFLAATADKIGADWGYYVLSAPHCAYVADDELYLALFDDKENFAPRFGGKTESAGKKSIAAFDFHKNARVAEGRFYAAFDDVVALDYYGEFLKGYFFRDGKTTIFDAIAYYRTHQTEIDGICANLNEKIAELAEDYTPCYKEILYAAYRQSVGAHKLAETKNGELLFVSKECSSAGCSATVDVSFPSMPLFLKFNPDLVRGMILPVFDFAETPVWQYPFAPHDAGVYPHCTGQWYGINKEKIESDYRVEGEGTLLPVYAQDGNADIFLYERQMPVEECGNMLILTALADKYKPDDNYLNKHFALLEKWAEYLDTAGLIPESQLCTDDFAGHLDKNVNLAVKATLALKCFSYLCGRKGLKDKQTYYLNLAKKRAAEILSYRKNGILPLTFDGTEKEYSLKYNLYIDALLGEPLFEKQLIQAEVARYKKEFRRFGLPLDCRAAYGKSDWMAWIAAISGDKDFSDKIFACIYDFLQNTPEKYVFSDWFDTDEGTLPIPKFRGRSVQGGLFAPCLINKKQ